MPTPITVEVAGRVYQAELADTPFARKVYKALPIAARGNRWGEEIYFSTPVSGGLDETADDVVPVGTIGYWPPGKAICFFFGPTPVSEDDECRAASPVNQIGRFLSDTESLKQAPDGAEVVITA
ncbi:hypothetical protein HS125_06330 [bacterium]|nr:hypothetical protein [bacterium]